ncbi:MAG: vitamin K epoxide reductase family protein [bacterium]|nr:vitamin K epoxide reductase family protein [bacterium]
MKQKTALLVIGIIALCGLLFSGYLSYNELFSGGCNLNFISCGTRTGPIFGLPACVYGFFMYLTVFIIVVLGLRKKS